MDNKNRIALLRHAVVGGIFLGTLVGAVECLRTVVDTETLLSICVLPALAAGSYSMLYLWKRVDNLW